MRSSQKHCGENPTPHRTQRAQHNTDRSGLATPWPGCAHHSSVCRRTPSLTPRQNKPTLSLATSGWTIIDHDPSRESSTTTAPAGHAKDHNYSNPHGRPEAAWHSRLTAAPLRTKGAPTQRLPSRQRPNHSRQANRTTMTSLAAVRTHWLLRQVSLANFKTTLHH